jgi:hypothetical protein
MSDQGENLPVEANRTAQGLDFTAQELLTEIIRAEQEQARKPGEFTVEDYMAERERAGLPEISKDKARSQLYLLRDQGILSQRKTGYLVYFSRKLAE